eukprot:1385497-Prorocentrum_lima.AAC.1
MASIPVQRRLSRKHDHAAKALRILGSSGGKLSPSFLQPSESYVRRVRCLRTRNKWWTSAVVVEQNQWP